MKRYIVECDFGIPEAWADRDDIDLLHHAATEYLADKWDETTPHNMVEGDPKMKELEKLGVTAFAGYQSNYGIDLNEWWVHPRIKRFFDKHGYIVVGAEYFYFAPHHVMDIHIDGAYYCRKAKFNWASHKDHTFRFFEPKDSIEGMRDGIQSATSAYSWGFDESQVVLQEEAPQGTPSLVCVGVPHQVINGSQPLELFNVCVWKKGTRRDEDLGGMDMEEALEDFKDYVL